MIYLKYMHIKQIKKDRTNLIENRQKKVQRKWKKKRWSFTSVILRPVTPRADGKYWSNRRAVEHFNALRSKQHTFSHKQQSEASKPHDQTSLCWRIKQARESPENISSFKAADAEHLMVWAGLRREAGLIMWTWGVTGRRQQRLDSGRPSSCSNIVVTRYWNPWAQSIANVLLQS